MSAPEFESRDSAGRESPAPRPGALGRLLAAARTGVERLVRAAPPELDELDEPTSAGRRGTSSSEPVSASPPRQETSAPAETPARPEPRAPDEDIEAGLGREMRAAIDAEVDKRMRDEGAARIALEEQLAEQIAAARRREDELRSAQKAQLTEARDAAKRERRSLELAAERADLRARALARELETRWLLAKATDGGHDDRAAEHPLPVTPPAPAPSKARDDPPSASIPARLARRPSDLATSSLQRWRRQIRRSLGNRSR